MNVVDSRELVRMWLERRHGRQGFAIHKLAKSLGVSHAAVSHWLKGKSPVHPKYWDGIAAFFEVTPEHILDEASTQAESPSVTG